MRLRLLLLLVILAVFALPACGSLPTGQIPTDSEVKPWEKPEPDELLEDEDEGDDEDEDEGDAEGDAPATPAAPAAAAKEKADSD